MINTILKNKNKNVIIIHLMNIISNWLIQSFHVLVFVSYAMLLWTYHRTKNYKMLFLLFSIIIMRRYSWIFARIQFFVAPLLTFELYFCPTLWTNAHFKMLYKQLYIIKTICILNIAWLSYRTANSKTLWWMKCIIYCIISWNNSSNK